MRKNGNYLMDFDVIEVLGASYMASKEMLHRIDYDIRKRIEMDLYIRLMEELVKYKETLSREVRNRIMLVDIQHERIDWDKKGLELYGMGYINLIPSKVNMIEYRVSAKVALINSTHSKDSYQR